MPHRALLLALVVACAPQARADPLDDFSGTEDWLTKPPRRQVERPSVRRELDEAQDDFDEAQQHHDKERAEFARDRAELLQAAQALRARAKKSTVITDPGLDAELRRAEERALKTLQKPAPHDQQAGQDQDSDPRDSSAPQD